MERVDDKKDLIRQEKEAMLREHFHAVWQLAFQYLKDKPRAQAVSKTVFCRAFEAMDAGESAVSVSLELRAFTLEEVLRLKELEPSPEVDVYRPVQNPYDPAAQPYAASFAQPYAPPYYYGAYMQPYAPPAPYPPPQYAQPPYTPYAPAQYAQAPYAPYTAYAPPQTPPTTQPQTPPQAEQAPKAKRSGDRPRTETRPTAEAPKRADKPQRETPRPEVPAEEQEPQTPAVTEEPELGPAPYEGPTEAELNEEPVPHEITMTPEMEARRRKRARNARIVLAFNIVAAGIMLWVMLGLLRRIGIFPQLELGYTWFNTNFFKIF